MKPFSGPPEFSLASLSVKHLDDLTDVIYDLLSGACTVLGVPLSGCFVESSRVPCPWFLATFLFSCLLQKWSLALWNDSARPASCPATFALFKALCPPALTPKASTFDPKMYLGDVMLPGMLPLWKRCIERNSYLETLWDTGGRNLWDHRNICFASFSHFFLFHFTRTET